MVDCVHLMPRLATLASGACSRSELDEPVDEDTTIVQNVLDLMLITPGNPVENIEHPHTFFNTLLDCSCTGIRQVALKFFTQLCTGVHEDSQVNTSQILTELLRFLLEQSEQLDNLREICQERFELLCMLLQLTASQGQQWQVTAEQCASIITKLQQRAIVEDSSKGEPDGVLVGLLRVVQVLVTVQSELKHAAGPELVPLLTRDLFETPAVDVSRSTTDGPMRNALQPPRCKTSAAREAGFGLLIALCNTEWNTLDILLCNLRDLLSNTQVASQWGYNPSDQTCASAGRIGLKNLGNICYLNSMMQQLRMIPPFSKNMLSVEIAGKQPDKESTVLYQLQLMISSLQLSHRKAYNPVNFCKTIKDWDGQPVDTRIQQDMSEFFAQLMNNLEAELKDTKSKECVNEVTL